MIETEKIFPFFLCLLSLILTGCAFQGAAPRQIEIDQTRSAVPIHPTTRVPAVNPTTTITSTPTIRVRLSPTPTQQSDREEEKLPYPLPDLLLGIYRSDFDFCNVAGKGEIWLAPYPYNSKKWALSSSELNYRIPKWSPNGQWIAYVESKTEIIEDKELYSAAPVTIAGADTIWIMHPDRSEKRQVSDPIPNAMFSFIMGKSLGCESFTAISNLEWSPDGQYILFKRSWHTGDMSWRYSFYISEVSTGKTRLLFTQEVPSGILWMNHKDQFLVKGENQAFREVLIEDIDRITINNLPYTLPDEVSNNLYYGLRDTGDGNHLYAVFYFKKETDKTGTPSRVAVWKYDLVTGAWEKKIEMSINTWRNTTIFPDWIVTYEGKANSITYYDPENWKVAGTSLLPADFQVKSFSMGSEFVDKEGRTWWIFEGIQDKTHQGLWAIQIKPGKEALPQLILDYSTNSDYPQNLSIYEFQPQE